MNEIKKLYFTRKKIKLIATVPFIILNGPIFFEKH